MKAPVFFSFFSILALAAPLDSQATQLKLDFSGGGSVESPQEGSVDAYPGTAGQGWAGPWKLVHQPRRINLDAKVVEKKPFYQGEGKYLQIKFEHSRGTVSVVGGVSRAIGAETDGGIDFSKPYKFKCQFRLGEVSEPFTTSNDRVSFGASAVPVDEQSEERPQDVWNVSYRPEMGWMARAGEEKKVIRFGPKDLQIESDEVWTITCSFRPEASRFDVVLESSGGAKIEGLDLPIMASSPQTPPAMLNFLIGRQGEGKTAVLDLDNIEVTQN